MKQITLWLDPEAMARVKEAVGAQKVSEFVRAAVEAELKAHAKRTAKEAKDG